MRHLSNTFRSAPGRRLASWWMVAAMVLASLMPTVSRALAAQQPSALIWADVCSATPASGKGLARVALADLSDTPAVSIDDCAYCVLMLDRLGPAPSLELPVLAPERPRWRLPAPTVPDLRPDLRLAHPRAPPLA
ncbi:DUF2946 domain-containing protein [Curvibacter gracilis]|uniref:DUF2946 domain-containing protein n=1 Tax=Curvibacter gracilis TaxID=230310 RepID=UPI0004835EB9|nr:DUF2946 domain-containing protein [Curvibacter gracilis]